MMLLLALLASHPVPHAPLPPPSLERQMAGMYEYICLQTFPDDAAVERVMRDEGGIPLRPEEVPIYLHDDPGRGWRLLDGPDPANAFVVTIEAPPYHACSIRKQTAAGLADARPYRDVIDNYRSSHAGFTDFPERTTAVGDRLSTVDGAHRVTAAGTENLFRFAVHPADPADPHHYGVEIRYVHQLHAADIPD